MVRALPIPMLSAICKVYTLLYGKSFLVGLYNCMFNISAKSLKTVCVNFSYNFHFCTIYDFRYLISYAISCMFMIRQRSVAMHYLQSLNLAESKEGMHGSSNFFNPYFFRNTFRRGDDSLFPQKHRKSNENVYIVQLKLKKMNYIFSLSVLYI